MLTTAIPREAGRGTSLGKNVSLAGEEMEGSALPLKDKTKGKARHPSAQCAGGAGVCSGGSRLFTTDRRRWECGAGGAETHGGARTRMGWGE